jgi:hypothetical protein
MKTMTRLACMAAFTALAASSVRAEESFRLAVIDPLSGPGAMQAKSWQFLAGEINAAGGLKSEK